VLRHSTKSSAGYRGLLALGFASPWLAAKELESELRALRRDLKRARQERDILKKAAAYFASQKS
jgi:transposase-like protein